MYSGIRSSRNGYASIVYPMTDKKHQKGVRLVLSDAETV